jgi:hypothetical protein
MRHKKIKVYIWHKIKTKRLNQQGKILKMALKRRKIKYLQCYKTNRQTEKDYSNAERNYSYK